MSATIVCKDGTTIPAEVIPAARCDAAWRRALNAERARAWREAYPELSQRRNRDRMRRERAKRGGE